MPRASKPRKLWNHEIFGILANVRIRYKSTINSPSRNCMTFSGECSRRDQWSWTRAGTINYYINYFRHVTNDDQNIPEGTSCTVANYRATGLNNTIRVLNTSTNNGFRFADGTGVQKSSDLTNQFFVSFTEVGSCDSYDQYAYDKENCNAFNRPPVLPDQDSDYLQGMKAGKCLVWVDQPVFLTIF